MGLKGEADLWVYRCVRSTLGLVSPFREARCAKGTQINMRSKFHRFIGIRGVCIWLWVLALVAQASAVAPVLCVKMDGQVEVEATCTCHRGPASHGIATISSSGSVSEHRNLNDRCGRCFDLQSPIGTGVPVGVDQGLSPGVKSLRSEAFAVSPTTPTDVAVDIQYEVFASHRSPPDKSSLVSLRTTVLLC
jgi:hypothetical protein